MILALGGSDRGLGSRAMVKGGKCWFGGQWPLLFAMILKNRSWDVSEADCERRESLVLGQRSRTQRGWAGGYIRCEGEWPSFLDYESLSRFAVLGGETFYAYRRSDWLAGSGALIDLWSLWEYWGESTKRPGALLRGNIPKGWVGLAARTSLRRVWSNRELLTRARLSRYKRSQKMKITILLKGIVIFTSVRRSYHSHSKTWNIQREIPM